MDDKQIGSWLESRRNRKNAVLPEVLFDGIRSGNIASLSSAITLLESTRPADKQAANLLIQMCLPFAGKSIRVGITGVPGVGKSTFIETFGMNLIQQGKKLAVLAIDPSSGKSGGSILGDKTRMNELSMAKNAFIRPSPAGDSLGGVARKTRESILLCEAAGFDYILVETVGVGQSETAVHSMVDFFLLLMLAGAGDELQGIKRGIMEMADALVITKADGDNVKKSNLARQEYQNAMHLFPPNKNGWIPKALTCSSLEGHSIGKIRDLILEFVSKTKDNQFFELRRHEQDQFWMHETLKELILADFFEDETHQEAILNLEKQVVKGEISSFAAAEKLYRQFKNKS
jgi:LAO/AO transport system kinase